jgi:hypothetical protein
MSHRRVRSGQTAPAPRNPSTGQDANWNGKLWYFCQSCRARVRRDHKNSGGFFCPGPVYEMDGYVQIPRKEAKERTWRLWMTRFCQPFRELKR